MTVSTLTSPHVCLLPPTNSGFTPLCEKAAHEGATGVDQLTKTLNAVIEAVVEGLFVALRACAPYFWLSHCEPMS